MLEARPPGRLEKLRGAPSRLVSDVWGSRAILHTQKYDLTTAVLGAIFLLAPPYSHKLKKDEDHGRIDN